MLRKYSDPIGYLSHILFKYNIHIKSREEDFVFYKPNMEMGKVLITVNKLQNSFTEFVIKFYPKESLKYKYFLLFLKIFGKPTIEEDGSLTYTFSTQI